MAKSQQQPLVVTTERGAFFGYGQSSLSEEHIRLTDARMIVHWSADCRSIVGLAATGPSNGCRIGPKAPAIVIRNVTAIIECSDEAAKKFEAGPWSR